MVGADPRFPASEVNPTSRNDRTMPTRPASSACQKDTLWLNRYAAYPMPSTPTFAAHHGQNNSDGLPLRSIGAMTLMPLSSTAGNLVCSWLTPGCMSGSMTALILDGFRGWVGRGVLGAAQNVVRS